jgi:hypothetical protein
MQGSCAVLDQWFTNKIREIGAARAIERAWDIGCGGEDEGKTPTAATAKRGKVVKKIFPAVHLRGSEPDERALQPEEYDEWDRLSVEDILEQRIFSVPAWDLIVFGDVLEHVPYSVGLSIIDWAYHNTSWVIALWPTNYVHGTGKDGNRSISSVTACWNSGSNQPGSSTTTESSSAAYGTAARRRPRHE